MTEREIIPLKQGLDFRLELPGSKSITNRAFLCAALAKGKSRLYGALDSDDTVVMMKALRKLEIRKSKIEGGVEIEGCGGKFKKGNFKFDLHNAGTATRFLTAIMVARSSTDSDSDDEEGETVITGDKRMQERPIADLIDGLRQLGASIEYLGDDGYPPLKIRKSKIDNRNLDEYVIKMKGDKSSQYFSALLMLGPLLDQPLKIEVEGELVSKPYIDITIAVMKAFGVKVKNNSYQSFQVKPQQYKATDYIIEGDASAASYWTSMAYLHNGNVSFSNLNAGFLNKKCVHKGKKAIYSVKTKKLSKKSIQGDSLYTGILKKFKSEARNLTYRQTGPKSEVIFDMNDMPDVAMTAAITASFKKGETKITGLSTLRIKETDRLMALEKELRKVGVDVRTSKDSITIRSTIGPTIGSTIGTYNDHRMAMCFAVMGTKVPGVMIENPGCTNKTYPQFWEDLERMYLSEKVKLGKRHLVLIGMRGSGKTYFGKKIAKILGREFIDLDQLIEKCEGMTISELVKSHGWDHFRRLESMAVEKVSELKKPVVIATGGGVVLDPKNMKLLKQNGKIVFIFAPPSVLAERIKKSKNRPSLTGKGFTDELQSIWQERRDLYLKYADIVWDDTSGKVVKNQIQYILS